MQPNEVSEERENTPVAMMNLEVVVKSEKYAKLLNDIFWISIPICIAVFLIVAVCNYNASWKYEAKMRCIGEQKEHPEACK